MTDKQPVKRSRRLTKALKSEIYHRIIDGESIRQICADEHMPNAETVHRAIASQPDFHRTIELAKQFQSHEIADEILEIADNATAETLEEVRRRIEDLKRRADDLDREPYGAAALSGRGAA